MLNLSLFIIHFVVSTGYALELRFLTKKNGFSERDQIRYIFEVISILFLGSLTFTFFSPFHLSGNLFYLFLLVLICGVFGGLFNLYRIFSQRYVEAGVSTIIFNLNTPVIVLLSSFFLNEFLNSRQIVGMLLLLVSVFIVSNKHRIGKFKFDKYFLFMVFSSAMLGILLVAERALMKTTGFTAAIIMSWGAQAFFLGIITLFTKSKRIYSKKETIITGVSQFLSSTSWVVLVSAVGNLSLVSSVVTFRAVVVFLAAAIFLGERENLPRKLIGSAVAIIGLFLMK